MTDKVMNSILKYKTDIIGYALGYLHWCISFFTDHYVFEALPGDGVLIDLAALTADSLRHYIVCKLVMLVLALFLWRTLTRIAVDIVKAVRAKKLVNDDDSTEYAVFRFALPYIAVIAAVMVFKLPEGFLSNDETLIFAEAGNLNTYTWFYYLTTYYYICTMMLIPSWLGPILVKVFLQLSVCGYSVYRMYYYIKGLYPESRKCRISFIMYIPFMMFPVLAYTTSAHRIPIYYLLYVLMLFVMVMDRLQKVSPDRLRLFWLMVTAALLTQWRTEGIYMAALSLILYFLSYPELLKKGKKTIFLTIVSALLIQYVVQSGQNGLLPGRMQDQADNRMGPFWAYTITNMYRNGLDLEKNREDMEKIWRYLDKDTLQAINDDLVNINYEDVLILYYPGYTGKIETATPEDYNEYVTGCKNVFKNNPEVLLRTRWNSFKYAALPYHMNFESGILGLVFSIVKGAFYNLFIPCIIGLIGIAVFLIKKKWQYVLMLCGLACHWFIVFVLAPASYFKYYLPIYMTVYFGVALAASIVLLRQKSK